MKLGKIAVLSAAALLVAALGGDFAEARPGHRHFHGGARVVFFAPVFVPRFFYYPPPYYYYPPPVYIEQPQRQSQSYWYFCPESRGYYPHVRECPGGWQRVAPQPPPG